LQRGVGTSTNGRVLLRKPKHVDWFLFKRK
jgi:hypothetical protein